MIEITGNSGKSELLLEISKKDLVIVLGDESYIWQSQPDFYKADSSVPPSRVITFIKSTMNPYRRIIIYSNWRRADVLPYITFLQELEQTDSSKRGIVMYRG